MTEIGHLSDEEEKFLSAYLPPASQNAPQDISLEDTDGTLSSNARLSERPFVTLTYACSLDSMISLAPGVRTTLSGPATKSMTHYLRLHHDSILVGAGTAVADNPSLNCRCPGTTLDKQPRPIVLDTNRRFNLERSQLLQLAEQKKGKQPWIIQKITSESERPTVQDDGKASVVFVCPQTALTGASEKLGWKSILRALKLQGINSLMVEGGATIINDLLSQSDLVDSVIVTIAPTWLGHGGMLVSPGAKSNEHGEKVNAAHLDDSVWKQFGNDVVLCGKPRK